MGSLHRGHNLTLLKTPMPPAKFLLDEQPLPLVSTFDAPFPINPSGTPSDCVYVPAWILSKGDIIESHGKHIIIHEIIGHTAGFRIRGRTADGLGHTHETSGENFVNALSFKFITFSLVSCVYISRLSCSRMQQRIIRQDRDMVYMVVRLKESPNEMHLPLPKGKMGERVIYYLNFARKPKADGGEVGKLSIPSSYRVKGLV